VKQNRLQTVSPQHISVADWLNLRPERRWQRRLAGLVGDIQRSRQISSKHRRELNMRGDTYSPPLEETRELARLTDRINKVLRRWNLRPVVSDPLLQPVFQWQGVQARRHFEGLVMGEILRLWNEGLVERLRCCLTCSKWILAKKSDQKFCKAACRQKCYQADPVVRERRREYNREYMRGFRARSTSSLKQRRQNP
jgi:hypothetical protein